jgi:hypothetical protein
VDPVAGGNENSYNYPNDPVNVNDTTGRCFWDACVGEVIIVIAIVGALTATTYYVSTHPNVAYGIGDSWKKAYTAPMRDAVAGAGSVALRNRDKPAKVNGAGTKVKGTGKQNTGTKKHNSRADAEKNARADAAGGGPRCVYRGPCAKNNHVHVDYYNKNGQRVLTRHYPWKAV